MDNEFYRIDKDLVEGTARENLRERAAFNHGARSELPNFYRFAVLETVFDPTLVTPDKVAHWEHDLGVSNTQYAYVLPRNAIIARRVLDGNTPVAAPAMFLFPFFPPALSLPCQPGEHVWVMFENQSGTKNDLGYWFCRIVEPGFVEDVNHTHAPRAGDVGFNPGVKDIFEGNTTPEYSFRNGRTDVRDGHRYTVAESASLPGDENEYEKIMLNSDAGKLATYEPVPRYRKRPGDIVLEGTNNALLAIGKDRTGPVAGFTTDQNGRRIITGLPVFDDPRPGSGAIDIVAGRGQTPRTGGVEVTNTLGFREIGKSSIELSPDEGDPDFLTDRSRIHVAQRTSIDLRLNIAGFNAEFSTGQLQGHSKGGKDRDLVIDSVGGDGGIVIKSDKVRLIARSDLEILVTGYVKRDENNRIVESTDTDEFAAVVIKANGDIVFRPSKKGFIKLGGDDANKGILCTDQPVSEQDGVVIGPPLTTTGADLFGGSKAGAPNNNGTALSAGQGKFAAKVLIK